MSYDYEPIMDDVNWHILRDLQQDARITFAELGRRVGLTAPAVAERVRRMEAASIIKGYRVELAMDRIGLPLLALVRIATSGEGRYEQILAIIRDRPEVLECHRVTGADSYFVKVAVSSVQHLQEFLERLVPYGQPTTSIILSSPVTHQVVGGPPSGWPAAQGSR